MSNAKFVNDAEIIEFVLSNTALFADASVMRVEEIGDGNINFVYRITNGQQSVIVKQALPYIRIIGEGWPLSLDRIRIEAQCLQEEGTWAADYVPAVYYFDLARSAFIMQDIGDHENLRYALIERRHLPELGRHLGEFLAESLFHTSDFYLDTYQKKAAVADYINPDLCKISEELFFWDPFCDHERNSVHSPLKEAAQALWQNNALKTEVATLKYHFMNNTQALLHADLHSGSVFVKADGTRVIDPEFAFYGPMSFDVGSIIGNFLLNFAGQLGLKGEAGEKQAYREYLLTTIETLWVTFAARFKARVSEKCKDPVFSSPEFVDVFIANVWHESMGYAGTELIRRTIGLAHVADLDSIKESHIRVVSEKFALDLGSALIQQRKDIKSPQVLKALIQAI